jgi:phosphoribosylformylglycinamidine cyclo-ligase
MRYDDSGVNIERAKHAKKKILRLAKSTWGKSVLSKAGAFAGLFELDTSYENPILVSSIDGVGTKVVVAKSVGRFDTIGQDLVNHCINDILVQGARPLFFLDYIAAAALDATAIASVIEGIATACKENGCALIGGETAEMPGVYVGGELDVAGCVVGVVERRKIVDGSGIHPGDVVCALPSTGLHTNGYSLARKILFDTMGLGPQDRLEALDGTVGEELLKVHASYLKPVLEMMTELTIKGMAHITGGGVYDNVARILPKSCDAVIDKNSWPIPKIFDILRENGEVPEDEMFKVFNMGLGMLVFLDAGEKVKIQALRGGTMLHEVGEIRSGTGSVRLV